MLSARAYSFKQNSRLAISLSWIGGFTNVVAILAMSTQVANVTGTATQLGHWIGERDFHHAAFFAFILCTFTSGAILSALVTEGAKRRGWRSKYVLPIGIEAGLLSLLVVMLRSPHFVPWGARLYLAAGTGSLAMGLQNATITRISGSVVRTTHVSGIFTDLGLETVQYFFWWCDKLASRRWERAGRLLKVSRRHPTALRLLLLLSIATSFGFGAIVASLAYSRWNALALIAPIAFLTWIVLVDLYKPIADIRELDRLSDPDLAIQGVLGKLLPPEVVLYRATTPHGSSAHRAPDFQLWVDRVPETCHVLILVVSPLTRFDENAVMDLGAAIDKLHHRKQVLILSGITTHQYKALDALGVARMMDVNNLCPDLEFAIARSIAVREELAPRPARRPELTA